MPSVKIEVGYIRVELEANEASVSDLGKQAIELAKELNSISPARMGMGFKIREENITQQPTS